MTFAVLRLLCLAALLQSAPVPPAPGPVDLGALRDGEGSLSAVALIQALPELLDATVLYDADALRGRQIQAAGSLLAAPADVRALVEGLLDAQGVLLLEQRAGPATLLRAVPLDRRPVTSLAAWARPLEPGELAPLATRRVLVSVRLPVPCGDARALMGRLPFGAPDAGLSLQPTADGRALDVLGVSARVAALQQHLRAGCP